MRSRERGVALLLTLLVLTILIVLIAQMSVTAVNTKTISENYLNDLQNGYGARAGYAQGVLYLEADLEKAPAVDHLGERWAGAISIALGRAAVTASVEDSERRINLSQINKDDGQTNTAVVNQFRRLVAVLGHPDEVADRIVDYIDADTKGMYESGARNARLYNLEELLRIEGVPREALYGGEVSGRKVEGILKFVTLWPTSSGGEGATPGAVNINTAPVEVLLALSDKISVATANAIVAYRAGRKADGSPQAFESTADLKNVTGVSEELFTEISPQLTVKGSHFEIRVRSAVGNVAKTWLYVVKRTAGSQQGTEGQSTPASVSLVTSQKSSDFLATMPAEETK